MNNYGISTQKILGILFKNPTTKFHIRELARISNLNPNTVINSIKDLEKENLIKKEEKKHIVEIYLNLENKKIILKKRIFNISQIYDSGIVDFLIENYSPNSISLIGSYSKGEDIENADIDIVIFSENQKVISLTKFEKFIGRKIHLLIIKKEKISDEFFNNLINGFVLYGYIRK
jgi:predicted nucleotidyltransferase